MLQSDVGTAIERLKVELRSKVKGEYKLISQTPTAPRWDPLDLAIGGREVLLEIEGDGTPEHRLSILWGLAVPLGWTPWERWPVLSATSRKFHFFGPWQCIVNHLAGSGRGEAVWPSVCAASQCEAGTWEGGHTDERWIQALLHRLLYNPGPVDGVIGPQTQGALRALGLGSMSLRDAKAALERKQPPEVPAKTPVSGRISLGEVSHQVHTFGQVQARRDGKGTTVWVRGAGRIVIDLWP